MPSGLPEPFPPVVPSEFEFLPNDTIKFHISARGEPGTDNDTFCMAVYGAPCQAVCLGYTGKGCGTDGFFPAGSFTFEEWGLADQTFAGFNHGLISVTTATGQADVRFAGSANNLGVNGDFALLNGRGGYKKLKGQGTYTGGAGYVFTVDYAPCGGADQPPCPANQCAVFGDDLKIKEGRPEGDWQDISGVDEFGDDLETKKGRVEWKINNDGNKHRTISRIMAVWLNGEQPNLTSVKLGGKTIYRASLPAPAADITSGWNGQDKDRQIDAGKEGKLELQFGGSISQNPWDYTILVQFAEDGCAVPFVAFPPPTPAPQP